MFLFWGFRNFCGIVLFYDMLEFWIIRRNGPACPSYLKLHSYIKLGVFQCISFFTIFCGQIPNKSKVQKIPPVWLVLDIYFCCVGQFGSIGKSTILVSILAKYIEQPCDGHMTSTWPRWLPRKSHLENFKFTIFLVKYNFSASATGTNLSLSRSPVNQVKDSYCLRSQLTF